MGRNPGLEIQKLQKLAPGSIFNPGLGPGLGPGLAPGLELWGCHG
jgi:hypothetical protein